MQQSFLTLDERLAGREFIASDRFSIADVIAMDFGPLVKIKLDEHHPSVQPWRTGS